MDWILVGVVINFVKCDDFVLLFKNTVLIL